MMNFTPEQLIAYYYHELPKDEYQAITEALQENWALREKYQVLCEAAERLNRPLQKPSFKSIEQVLSHVPQRFSLEMHNN